MTRKKKVPRNKVALEIAWDMFRLMCSMGMVSYVYDKELKELVLMFYDKDGEAMDMICRVYDDELPSVLHSLLLK